MRGDYEAHIRQGGCPSTNGDVFCADVVHHELIPPAGRGNLHWAKLFSPLTGSETREWS